MEIPNTNTYQVIRGLEALLERLKNDQETLEKHISILKLLDNKPKKTAKTQKLTPEVLELIKNDLNWAVSKGDDYKFWAKGRVEAIFARTGIKITAIDYIKEIDRLMCEGGFSAPPRSL